MLRRYWFTFELPFGDPLFYGCGITAYGRQDAMLVLRDQLFRGKAVDQIPRITSVDEDVDMAGLKPNVRTNMGSALVRGVWFPKGF
jgi:hypothetical protein